MLLSPTTAWDFPAFWNDLEIKNHNIYEVISILSIFYASVMKAHLRSNSLAWYGLSFYNSVFDLYLSSDQASKHLVVLQKQMFELLYRMKQYITSYPLKPRTGTNTLSATSSECSVTWYTSSLKPGAILGSIGRANVVVVGIGLSTFCSPANNRSPLVRTYK